MPYSSELSTAIDAVQKACRLGRMVQAELKDSHTITKSDDSPVTIADFGIQAMVFHLMGRAFPDDRLVGEEDTQDLRQPEHAGLLNHVVEHVRRIDPVMSRDDVLAGIGRPVSLEANLSRFWTLDPVDGTKGFLRGDQYSVALALVVDGEVALGVLGCPNMPVNNAAPDSFLGCIFSAVKGEGANVHYLDIPSQQPAQVDCIDDPTLARFCESVESGHTSHSGNARVAELLGISRNPLRVDSQAKYGAIARGDASVYLRLPSDHERREWIWDHAAGKIVVEEAGGTVTDLGGAPLDFSRGWKLENNNGVIASNGLFHERILEAAARGRSI